jgi:LMBR1 domain-containing protein 1
LGITFKEFAADFIKDESNIWWFIGVKGFIID